MKHKKFKNEVRRLWENLKENKSDKDEMINSLNNLNSKLNKKRKVILFYDRILRSELRSELGSELGSELWGELGSELWGELGSKLGGELGGELWEYYENIWIISISKIYPALKIIKKNIEKIRALEKCNDCGIGYILISKNKLIGINFNYVYKRVIINRL